MNALVLAAGYATRLYPLTESFPKPLLPVGGRPLLDHILELVNGVPDVRHVHVVTNAKFAGAFRAWAEHLNVEIHDDGTTSDEGKLGAIGDIRFVVERARLAGDDLLVIAGDNLFDFSLADYVAWWRGKGEASAIALHDVGDRGIASKYGIVELADDERVVTFLEKPADPPSTLAATATYLYHRSHLPLLDEYLARGNSPDQPGHFIAWLHTRAPVYGFRFEGAWMDIGGHEELLAADNRMRAVAGLPPRETYSLH